MVELLSGCSYPSGAQRLGRRTGPAANRLLIGGAMPHRAANIAYAPVRDQTGYDPTPWPDHTEQPP